MNFQPLPRFEKHQIKIMDLIPKWEMLYMVKREQIEKQIVAAHVWCDANPERSPKKQVTRFLNSWMRIAKAYNHLNSGEVLKKPLYKEQEPEGEVMTAEDFRKMREAI